MNIAGRILVADGVPTTRITTKVKLAAACYDVSVTASGQEALRLAATVHPHIVLIGATLSDMTAAELCQALRARPGGADLPVLVQAQGGERIGALRAGASALIDSVGDDLTLLARIRGLIRADNGSELVPLSVAGMAETALPFRGSLQARALCITHHPATALGWRLALQDRLQLPISISDPERALADAARGDVPDLYLIAADMKQPGEGLRLLSELRSRPVSRDAAFVVLLANSRLDLAPVALDLGAGDVLPAEISGPTMAAEAAIRLEAQIERKRDSDRRRQESRRNMLWAMIDPLTGLYNRRFALPRLETMFAEAGQAAAALSVMVLDLDRFKQVNDLFGHAAGDAVLAATARRLEAALPEGALLARLGGEEFLVVIADCSAGRASELAENMRRNIASQPIPLPAGCGRSEASVTISTGIAIHEPFLSEGEAGGTTSLLARADRALFRAKSAGRNRVVLDTAPLAA
ncbi:diguanylate cyclase [Paracoccus sp. MBLB3053]|uniref:diguanylate cyclase n=1 Tax=Paracoccus aurantius TaxID=3073814 RepID=A0ABU2HVU3_9RHOB|nr:diguanylate cyclase [Paracoccus sp. MBLB3053]MDS9468409.1 diguanylate cyclase [Paracoccus sp. MBLB3053]